MKKCCILLAMLCVVGAAGFLCMSGCNDWARSAGRKARIRFSLQADPDVYLKTRHKGAPQFAVWIVDPTKEPRTVFVTNKSGAGKWGGETKRPICLPIWVSNWNRQFNTAGDPTAENAVPDAITGATPLGEFTCFADVPAGQAVEYYIEVNCSGDFTDVFTEVASDGRRDINSNGQPSIIYKGKIVTRPGNYGIHEIIGRSEQFDKTDRINPNLNGIRGWDEYVVLRVVIRVLEADHRDITTAFALLGEQKAAIKKRAKALNLGHPRHVQDTRFRRVRRPRLPRP